MSDVTHILQQIESGQPSAAEQLLPLVYDELRKLAVAYMAQEAPGHTLNATALVHDAYLRLVGDQHFDGRGHFFAAAATGSMRGPGFARPWQNILNNDPESVRHFLPGWGIE